MALPATSKLRGHTAGDLVNSIRMAILRGDFAPNQRLIESDLSESFGASRASVRAALIELAGEGLVDRLPNRGSRVRIVTRSEAVEMLEVRAALEELCAAKAAERIQSTQAERLTALKEQLIRAVDEGDLLKYSELHPAIDALIIEISDHATAAAVIERLRAQVVRHQFRLSFLPGRAAVSCPEHVEIVEAVVAGDPERARRAVAKHMQGVVAAVAQLSP